MNFRMLTLAALLALVPLTAAKAAIVFQSDEILSSEVEVVTPLLEPEVVTTPLETAAVDETAGIDPLENAQSSENVRADTVRSGEAWMGAIPRQGDQANSDPSLETLPDLQAETQSNIAQFRAVAAAVAGAASMQFDNRESSVGQFQTVVAANSALVLDLTTDENLEKAPSAQGKTTHPVIQPGEAEAKDAQMILAGGSSSRNGGHRRSYRRSHRRSYRRGHYPYRRYRRGYSPFGFYPGGGIYLRFGGGHHRSYGGFYPSFGLHYGFPYRVYRRNYFPYSRHRRNYFPYSRYNRIYYPYGRHRFRYPW